jgi:hypothetical protein
MPGTPPQAWRMLTLCDEFGAEVVDILQAEGGICARFLPDTAEELMACLGLVHLAMKKVAEVRGAAPRPWYLQEIFSDLPDLAPFWRGELEELTTSDLESFPPDAQRAMMVLRAERLRCGVLTSPHLMLRQNERVGPPLRFGRGAILRLVVRLVSFFCEHDHPCLSPLFS